MAFFLPLLLGAGSFLAGKSSGGGGIEILTSKKSTQTTNAQQYTTSNVYSPTITRNFDVQYNIASGGSSISTKKELGQTITPSTSPTISPTQTVSPITSQGGAGVGGGSSGGGIDWLTIALLGGGAWYLLKGRKK